MVIICILLLALGEWTTRPSYSGAILTAVCMGLVVAPPTITGMEILSWRRHRHTSIICASDGVMSPLRHTKSALWLRTASTIVAASTITPKSMISQPPTAITTETMFLPMSWMSPLTVAITTLGVRVCMLAETACVWSLLL